jgi:hypothetical protein
MVGAEPFEYLVASNLSKYFCKHNITHLEIACRTGATVIGCIEGIFSLNASLHRRAIMHAE